MKSYQKEFKFSIKNSDGLTIIEEIVCYGSEERPFPNDWDRDGVSVMAILDYKDAILKKYFEVEVDDEDLKITIQECTEANIVKALKDEKAKLDKSNIKMDLGDIGNIIGMEVMKAIQNGDGSWDDFLKGLKHGKSLIDGSN